MKEIVITGIRFYRRWISPVFPGSCRFYPTCSAYAMEAVSRHGVWKGSAKAAMRIMKCHPWHPGGYDPVSPQAEEKCREIRNEDTDGSDCLSFNITPDKMTDAPRTRRHKHAER